MVVKVTNDVNEGVANVVELVRDEKVDLILGSPSSAGKKSYCVEKGLVVCIQSG